MPDIDVHALAAPVLDPEPRIESPATVVPITAPSLAPARVPLHPAALHPAVLVDPRLETLAVVQSLRAQRTPLVTLSARRLEPAVHARSVRRVRVPALAASPERWQARLLSLAAQVEPRPVLWVCSEEARAFVADARRMLEPHYDFATPLWSTDTAPLAPDAAIRAALQRGEAAIEVQVVRDAAGRCTGSCALAWAAVAPPDVVVTSVASPEVTEQSEMWLASRAHRGYARLVWTPNRFGRLALAGASSIPGAGLALAVLDGVDLPALAHAAAIGDTTCAPQSARLRLVRRLVVADGEDALVELPDLEPRDVLARIAAYVRSLVRR